ncbi:MAG: site-specific integrase [Methylibium sp.]|nr:site-specific integrase [Methylibium sp.]
MYESGHTTSAAAKQAIERRVGVLERLGKPRGLGPHRTTFAQALQDYGLERLPLQKGALQEANRINKFLRAAGLATLSVKRVNSSSSQAASSSVEAHALTDGADVDPDGDVAGQGDGSRAGRGCHCTVELAAVRVARRVPRGLGVHRKKLAAKTTQSDHLRARLSGMTVADVAPHHVQSLMNALSMEGQRAATVHLERAVIRRLFNYAAKNWNWCEPARNPGAGLEMPTVDNGRERVMSHEEQARLEEAVQGCRNKLVGPTLTLLRESAMRSSEPLEHARWRDVDWDLKILALSDGKTGKRDVPLSPLAIAALRQLESLGGGEKDDPIVHISYEALKASWELVCRRAGVKGLRLQDLRHTAATRMALMTGNIFLVQALTGHKTLSQVTRYVNVTAGDVVRLMHAEGPVVAGTHALQVVERVGDRTLTLATGSGQDLSFPQEWALDNAP